MSVLFSVLYVGLPFAFVFCLLLCFWFLFCGIKLHLDLSMFSTSDFVTEYWHHYWSSSMRDKILLPEGQVRLQGLERLRKKGMEVRVFAQKFWTRAERLGCQGADVKDIFNLGWMNPALGDGTGEVIGFLELLQVLAAPQRGKGNSPPPDSTCRGCSIPTSLI